MGIARIHLAATVVGLLAVASGAAHGQSNFQKLQERLGGGAAAASSPASAPASAPGPGYLGGEFDEPRGAQKGVVVNSVRPGGPAEAGGLKALDLITAIDGKAISDLNDLDLVLGKALVGDKLRMTVNRAGRLTDLTVTLGTRPAAPATGDGAATTAPPGSLTAPRSPTVADPAPALGSPGPAAERPGTGGAFSPRSSYPPPADAATPASPASPSAEPGFRSDSGASARSLDPRSLDPRSAADASAPAELTPIPSETRPDGAAPGAATGAGGPSLGITVDALNEQARQAHGLTVRRGALITNVRPGTPADRAGLPVGGVVVALDGRRVDSSDDLVTMIHAAQPGQEIELTYFEGPRIQRKTVTLAPASATAAPGSLPRLPGGSMAGGMSSDRGLLGQAERKVDNFVRGGVSGPSTVYDPSAMAALQAQVSELSATIKSLEERLRALEGNRGGSSIAPATTPAPAITPGFGTAPIGPSTPGFVPGLGQPSTNP